MASPHDAPSLMSRSPGSRKSLSVARSSNAPRARQRAKSIATANPEDDLTPRRKLRRSLQPKRSILKQSNFNGEDGSTNNTALHIAPHGAADEFTLNMTRASSVGLDRRVSFAPNAHVRVFEVKEQNTNGSSTPPSSPSVEVESTDIPHAHPQSPSSQVPPNNRSQSFRRSSLRNSFGGSDDAVDMEIESDVSHTGDQSMDLTNNSITASEEDSQPYQASTQNDRVTEQDEEEDEDGSVDMDITMNTNPVSRRQSRASVASRMRSSRRPSTAAPDADTSGEPMEFTIALGNRVKGDVEPAPEWYALQQLVLGRNDKDNPPPPEADADSTNPNNMDLQSAVERMLVAGAGIIQHSAHPADDDTFSSTNSSEGSIDMDNKTMDITQITGGIRRASTTQQILSEPLPDSSPLKPVLSVSTSSQTTLNRNALFTPKPPTSTSTFQAPLNPSTPAVAPATVTQGPVSAIKAQSKLPIFNKTPVHSSAKSPALPSGSTVKPKPSGFTVAFTTPATARSPGRTNLKRPFSVEDGEVLDSPAKKIVVPGAGGVGTKGVPVVPKSPTKIPQAIRSPVKSPDKTPSRKAGGPLKRLSAIAAGGSATARRASLRRGPLTTPKPPSPEGEPALFFTPAPLVFPPPVSSNVQANVSTPSRNKPGTPSPRRPSAVSPAPPPPAVEVTPRAYAREEARQATAPVVPATSPVRSPVRVPLAALPPSSAPVSPAVPASPWSKYSRRRTSSYALSQANENTYMGRDTGVYTISESGEEIDVPRLSLEEFLEMTGVTFMDNMTAHRRSTMALQSSRDPKAGPPTIADFAEAIAIEYPLLVYYDLLAQHLQDQTTVLEDLLQEIDDDVRENTPTVFTEYHLADPESQAEIRDVLNRCKTLSRTQAKSDWYRFKHSRVEGLCEELTDKKEKVATDLQLLASTHEEVDSFLKTFEERYATLTASLEKEKSEVAEIAKCDPGTLDEVKGTVVEQQAEIDALATEVAQIEKELAELEQQLTEARTEEINLRQREEAANRILSMQDINAEEELALTQRHVDLLHLVGRWEATKISPERVVFEYDRRIILNMPCSKFKPILSSCTLSNKLVYVKGRPHIDYCPIPEFTAYSMDCARRALVAGRFGSTTKKIVKSLTNFWTACAEIREEILMLQCKYAVGFHSAGNALRMEVPLLYMKSMAKVLLGFTFDERCIRQWPLTLPAIRFEAHLGYTLDGKDINMEDVDRTARDRIAQATLAEHYGTLVDACAEVADLYK